jgi:hypothetical protein
VIRLIDLLCSNCNYYEERSVDLRGCDTEEQRNAAINGTLTCPNCEETEMERVWVKAPTTKFGKDTDNHNIERMQKSFRQRFMKKELDDVKHKFGERVVNEALVSGEAKRIKDRLNDK